MNNDRRERLTIAIEKINEASAIVTECTEEEWEYFDNMPEGLQGSEKGDQASDVVDELTSITEELNDILSRVEECKE